MPTFSTSTASASATIALTAATTDASTRTFDATAAELATLAIATAAVETTALASTTDTALAAAAAHAAVFAASPDASATFVASSAAAITATSNAFEATAYATPSAALATVAMPIISSAITPVFAAVCVSAYSDNCVARDIAVRAALSIATAVVQSRWHDQHTCSSYRATPAVDTTRASGTVTPNSARPGSGPTRPRRWRDVTDFRSDDHRHGLRLLHAGRHLRLRSRLDARRPTACCVLLCPLPLPR